MGCLGYLADNVDSAIIPKLDDALCMGDGE
jgi:hypothetical protein